MTPFNKDRKFGKPAFHKSDSRGPRKFGTGPRTSSGPRPSGGRDFGKPSYGKTSFTATQLHDATCATCGAHCEVPFKPSGLKPVYCRDCFRKQEGEGPARPAFRRESSDRPARPAFQRDDSARPMRSPFRRPDAVAGPVRNDNLEKELEKINLKLDRILRTLDGN
jgi:CxxC-x17-CxxC domain-containing protein